MAKLTYSVNADNRLTLSAYGTPTCSGGGAKFDGSNVTRGKYAIDPLTGYPEGGRQRHLQLQRPPVRLHARSTPR